MQNQVPAVAVIVPLYNKAEFIAETLRGVLRSEMSIEVIVVDDGSTDGSLDILAAIKDARLHVIRQKHSGVSCARNAGLAQASAPYVVFLDADDRLAPDALTRFTRYLDAHPSDIAVYGSFNCIDRQGRPIVSNRSTAGEPFPRHRRPCGFILPEVVTESFLLIGTVCIRRAFVEAVGGFSPDLKFGEDWEFWCRLAAAGNFGCLGDPPVLQYRHDVGGAYAGGVRDPALIEAALEKVFSEPRVVASFHPRRRRRYIRLKTARAYFDAGYMSLRGGNWDEAKRILGRSLWAHYIGWKQLVLLMFATVRWMPARVRTHMNRP